MTLLKHLTIKNFRGFDFLEIDGFSKINLFVGKNNSGKTSVLESIFLVIGMSNPILPNTINQIRGLNTGSAQQLRYLFHNLSDGNIPSFTAKMSDSSERILKLEAKYRQAESINNPSSTSSPELIGIDLNFREIKGNKMSPSHKSSLIFGNDMFGNNVINTGISRDYNEKFHAVLVVADKNQNDLVILARLSEMIKRKEEIAILEILQKFDENILDIKTLPDGVFFDLKNVGELVPINIMGDGIRRFLNIVTSLYEKKDLFICIDEIENGLHYSAYRLLWKSLLSFSNINNVQLFITTHNIETLTCLKSVLEEEQFASMQEYCKAFAISRTVNAGHKSYRYSFEGFKDAIDHEAEIRN
ncbi:MAG: AAA family ATPase [Spirochaetaceae bacterium]|jgi:AAA15 family ATPase/GTPase|nr:AAA family ATPase [Spirochaetaceae bacterium]